VQALVTSPGRPGAVRVADVREPAVPSGGIRIRALEVGVCGTDREIADGEFGTAPPGEDHLVLGHEFVGRVEEDGGGYSAGDLVTATVRRSCGRCAACRGGSPDACDTGDYTERGITALHGFASELVVELPEHIVPVPPSLGRLGVLAEPASICARGIRHATAIGERQIWEPGRALVLGAGAIGMLATYQLRLAGLGVWTAARGAPDTEKGRLAAASGAEYVSTAATSLGDLRDAVGGFDLVIEATGNAEIMLAAVGLLRRNGVACLLGLDAHRRSITVDSALFGVHTVIENRVVFGSVNAHHEDWRAAVAGLEAMRTRWPDALERMVGLRVAPDRFADAFAHRGVKATLRFA
jgi:threonine dehydrogenase-like Zn-dependent dehydrogenase